MGISSSIEVEEQFNECNTPPITRVLPKNFDPRSPSEGISRTPIEVMCTPKTKDLKNQRISPLTFNTPKSSKVSIVNVENTNTGKSTINVNFSKTDFDEKGAETQEGTSTKLIDTDDFICNSSTKQLELNNEDNRNDCNHDNVNTDVPEIAQAEDVLSSTENKKSQSKAVYLETDIDAIEDNFNCNVPIEHPRVRQLRKCQEISNPLSNESTISLTSNVNDTVDTDTLSARIDSISFTDVSFDDSSFLVSDSDNEQVVNGPTKAINEWLITIEDDSHSLLPFDILRDNEENIVSVQKQCVTPNQKVKSSKERTPLGCLVQNKIFEPIKETSNKKKQWRGIEEERARRGLSLLDENVTPPMHGPLLEKVSSAPGKLMRYRKIDWDRDNKTMLI